MSQRKTPLHHCVVFLRACPVNCQPTRRVESVSRVSIPLVIMFVPTRLVSWLLRRMTTAARSQKYELTFGAPRGTPGSVTFLFYRVFEACVLAKVNPHVRQAYAMYFGCGMHLLHLFPVQFPSMMESALRRRVRRLGLGRLRQSRNALPAGGVYPYEGKSCPRVGVSTSASCVLQRQQVSYLCLRAFIGKEPRPFGVPNYWRFTPTIEQSRTRPVPGIFNSTFRRPVRGLVVFLICGLNPPALVCTRATGGFLLPCVRIHPLSRQWDDVSLTCSSPPVRTPL